MNTTDYTTIMKAVSPQTPSPQQEAVITSKEASILVVAGAGSGKTRTMTNRIAYWLGVGIINPSEVLGLTFTNKAAGELSERVAQSLLQLHKRGVIATEDDSDDKYAVQLERPTISTYNSFAVDIVTQYGLLIGVNPQMRLITKAESHQIMAQIVEALPYSRIKEFDAEPSSIVTNVLDLSAGLIDNGTSLEDARNFFTESAETLAWIANKKEERDAYIREMKEKEGKNPTPERPQDIGWEKGLSRYWNTLRDSVPGRLQAGLAACDLVEEYWNIKKERGLVEFADQVDMAVRILKANPQVCHEISSRYRLVLLDEYQDTSNRQAEMLGLALGQKIDQWRSVAAVGDPNQAIYGFRGASADAFGDFSRTFSNLGAPTIFPLNTTYRNDEAILEAANTVASAIDTQGVRVADLEPRDEAGKGTVVEIRPIQQKDSYDAMALRIRDKIREVREAELKKQQEDPGHTIRGAEIAVLCRWRSYFDDVAQALDKYGIPYEITGGSSLVARPEILTLRAALTAAIMPERGDAFARLFAYLNIGVADMHVINRLRKARNKAIERETQTSETGNQAEIKESSFMDILASLRKEKCEGLTDEARQRLLWLYRVLSKIQWRSNLPLIDSVRSASRDLGLVVSAVSRTHHSQAVSTALDSFAHVAGDYHASNPDSTLRDFLEWIDLVDAHEKSGEEESEEISLETTDTEVHPGIVQIMTIHAAKGLEWTDLVAIPEMVVGQVSAVEKNPDLWVTQKKVFPSPLRADKDSLPQFVFRLPRDDDYDFSGASSKVPTKENSPHYPLAQALKKYEKAELDYETQEARRLAYVAFTRVQDELLLVGYGRKGASTKAIGRSTFMEGVDATPIGDIALGNGETVYAQWAQEFSEETAQRLCYTCPDEYEADNVDNGNNEDSSEEEKEQKLYPSGLSRSLGANPSYDEDIIAQDIPVLRKQAELLLQEADERETVSRLSSFRPYFTASDIVSMSEREEEFLKDQRRPIPREPSEKARIGTEVHRQIAHSYANAPVIDLDMDWVEPHMRDSAIAAFMESYRQSRWANFPPLYVEEPLCFSLGGQVIRCTIDALLDTSRAEDLPAITIVDWKTGSKPSGQTLASRELQLGVYRLACAKVWGYNFDDIGAYFVYLNQDGTIEEVEAGKMSEEEISKLMQSVLSRA